MIITIPINAANDCCFAADDGTCWKGIYIDNLKTALGFQRESGMIFRNINIPKGSIINSAVINFHPNTNQSGADTHFKFVAENSLNPVQFSTHTDYYARSLMNTVVTVDSVPAWTTGNVYNSPDISTIIKEIIDRDDWEEGNGINIFWKNNASVVSSRNSIGWNTANHALDVSITIDYTPPDTTFKRYEIEVQDATGKKLGQFDTFRNLKFNKRLNNYGECSFEIPVVDSKANDLIALRVYTVWIYRVEKDYRRLVWAGEQATRTGKLDENANNWASIGCFDWLEQLNSRFTVYEDIYDNEDAGAIAKNLIEMTQADGSYGDLGIIIGTIELTANRDRTYHSQNIMQAIIDLSNLDLGYDFEITDSRVFNAKVIIGTDRTDSVIFEYGRNVKTASILEDFSKITNRSLVLGSAIGETDMQRVEVDDTVSQVIYKLREQQLSLTETSELDSFTDQGTANNAKNGTPLLTVSLTLKKSSLPSIGDFLLGDSIKLKIKSGLYDIDEDFRVFEWTIEYGVDNTELLTLVVGNFRLV